MSENVVLFGGSFDPIHNGHLKMALKASKLLNAKVIFIPSKNPRWKTPTEQTSDRLAMLKLAIEPYKDIFEISEWELNNDFEVNYTILTIKDYVNKHPDQTIYFLIGADQINKFDKWQDALEISKLVHIIFISRPGIINNQTNINKYHMQNIDGELSDTSSTDIRSLKSLDTPYSVIDYIIRNELYFVRHVKSFYNEKRYNHALEVAKLAFSIAVSNHFVRPDKAFITGYLHDVGKMIADENGKEIMEKYYRAEIDMPQYSYHQFIGETIAHRDFGIEDEEILSAIKCHATGKKNMAALDMVVYASDKIEPTRGFDSRDLIEACMKDYYQGFITVLKANEEYLIQAKKGIYNNPMTIECINQYLGK